MHNPAHCRVVVHIGFIITSSEITFSHPSGNMDILKFVEPSTMSVRLIHVAVFGYFLGPRAAVEPAGAPFLVAFQMDSGDRLLLPHAAQHRDAAGSRRRPSDRPAPRVFRPTGLGRPREKGPLHGAHTQVLGGTSIDKNSG